MKKIVRHFKLENYKLRIGRSKTGLGLFTEETIPRGACIVEYTGRPLAQKEQYETSSKYLFETGKNMMIDGNIKSNIARYINHSCVPNCEIDIRKQRVYIFAKRNLKAGEELNYDYGTEYFNTHIKPRGCLCAKCNRPKSSKRIK